MKKFLLSLLFFLILIFSLEVRKYEIYKNLKKFYSHIKPVSEISEIAIIFAPHCDDETLACAGIIQNLISSGKEVKVVVVTNGDGFKYAAEAEFKKFSLKPEDYIKFAYERQNETVEALKILGVKKENIIFLGYPDRGLLPMWSKYFNCEKLYTSPFTKDNFSPYYNSFTKKAPYCGKSLVYDLKNILAIFSPSTIYIPHPNDDHPDHRAVYCFVKLALKELKKEDIKIYTYLIHRGRWPQPQGFYPELSLIPPSSLLNLDTSWYKFELDSKEVSLKYRAFLQYTSQTRVMKRFLSSFIRKNEIFGTLKDVRIEQTEHLEIDGNSSDWESINSKILDAKGDNFLKYKSTDITSVYLAKDDGNIYIMVKTARNISRILNLKLNFHLIGKKNPNFQILIVGKKAFVNRKFLEEINIARRKVLEIKIPKKFLSEQFFFQIDGYLSKVKVENTCWRMCY